MSLLVRILLYIFMIVDILSLVTIFFALQSNSILLTLMINIIFLMFLVIFEWQLSKKNKIIEESNFEILATKKFEIIDKKLNDLLMRMSELLAHNRDYKTVSHTLLTSLRHIFEDPSLIKIGLVLHAVGDQRDLRILASTGIAQPHLLSVVSENRGIIAHSKREVDIVVLTEFANLDPTIQQIPTSVSIESLACMPLVAGGTLHGYVVLGSTKKDTFQDSIVQKLKLLTRITAIAFEFVEVLSQQIVALDKANRLETNARQEISRDIHDLPLSTLGILLSELDSIYLVDSNDKEKEKLGMIRESLNGVYKDLHDIISIKYPVTLETHGLNHALSRLVSSRKSGFDGQLELTTIKTIDEMLENGQKVALYYIVAEAISNSIRHADANEIKVSFEKSSDSIVLTISDDGKGFDEASVVRSLVETSTSGVLAIQDVPC